MTDAPQERPWLQFHLSTAVVLMFVAAGLLWLNMRPLPIGAWIPAEPLREGAQIPWHGWPLMTRYTVFTLSNEEMDGGYWNWQNCAFNALCAVVILLAVGMFCEWLLRRRERRP